MALAVALALTATIVGPAAAAKKKKSKGPKPYVSEEVTIQVGHSAMYGNSGTVLGITAQEFINTCAIPGSNGLDAYVFEVPVDYQKIDTSVSAIGTGGALPYDLDMFFFDEGCQVTGVSQTTSVDEIGLAPAGSAYILVHNFGEGTAGGGDSVTAHIELKPYVAATF